MTAARGSRRRAVLVAALALVSAMALVGSCGRTAGGDSPAPGGRGTVPPATTTTAPSPANRQDGAGPTSHDGIVPMGHARGEAGAAAAANAYLATLQQLAFSDHAARETALRRMAAASATDVVDSGLAALRAVDAFLDDAREQHSEAEAFLREMPVAYRVRAGAGDTEAQVDVWSLAVFLGDGRTDAAEVWSTNSVGLVWEADDWRVKWWVRASGPVPAGAREKLSLSGGVLRAVAGWKGIDHASET